MLEIVEILSSLPISVTILLGGCLCSALSIIYLKYLTKMSILTSAVYGLLFAGVIIVFSTILTFR